MSNAFGISEDDILAVLDRDGFGKVVSDDDLGKWFNELNHADVEGAALAGFDMDEQTNAAHDAIRLQLEDMGVYQELKARKMNLEMEASTPQAQGSAKPLGRP